jgi:HSP20 family molecular chaperone IbpA
MSSLFLMAEVDLQKGLYDAADEMMRYDEKMNQAIMRHNQITPERDREMRLNDNTIEDFEETDGGYLLEQEIKDSNQTKIDVTLSDGTLMISTTTIKEESVVTELETLRKITEKTSVTSLFIPQDADEQTMEKSYKDGFLKVRFLKKSS